MPAKLLTKIMYRKILAGCLFILMIYGCETIYDQEKYQKPDWLAGKLYTQLSELENLSTYKRCVEITGYDTILDRTGSYTIFAPNNQAFESWFDEHPKYDGSVENVPIETLRQLVKMHIIQDAWTLNQIQLLDVDGWIDKNDPLNNKPRAYKRQTILKYPNTKFWIKNDQGNITLVDSLNADDYRIVYTRSRKYIPIFFPEYFSLNNLSPKDYEFYYNRPYDNSTIHYANAKVLGSEVFAENGFIYEVDEVVDPVLNVNQLLNNEKNGFSYHYMRDIFRQFPRFTANMEETNRQFEARAGLDFDTLYTLRFPEFPFNIQEELTGPNTNNDVYTLRYQNGILVPDDIAFQDFIDNVMTGPSRWKSWEIVPIEVKRIILRNLMTTSPIYQTDILNGFYSGEGDLIQFDEDLINFKYYGSNATFLGLNKVIVPRAITSVAGPVYLRPGYSTFLYSMEYSRVTPAIKKSGADYSYFIIDDNSLANDSSLLMYWTDRKRNIYEFRSFDRSEEKLQRMSSKILAKRLLNQVGIHVPEGIANKEFIENLAGNYIVYNNINNEVRGGAEPTFGYKGDSAITLVAKELIEPADNGKTYEVNGWLVPPNKSMYVTLTVRPWFLDLLKKAGLYNDKTFDFTFITEGETYTIFVPSEQALLDYGADTLNIPDLQNLLKYHFIKGVKVFTDGRLPSGDFGTLRVDESSTPLFKKFTPMTLHTGSDQLEILDRSGNLLGTVYEEENKTNVMITTDTDEESTSVFDNITTSVLHEIDFVIHK